MLFSPITIHGVTLRNRIGISGHFAGWWADADRLPTADFAAYIEERAKGGVGLFVIGSTVPVDEPDTASCSMLNTDDRIVPRYRMLAEAGHRHGTRVFAQLIRFGFGSFPVPSRGEPGVLETTDQVRELVRAFGPAAARARAGGVDGLELHAHEGFYFARMLSPRYNTRTDSYGGPLVNRMRAMVEALTAMREAIGDEVPLGVRLKADDVEEGGNTVEDYLEIVARLEALRLVDYLSFTGGDNEYHHGPMARPAGEWLPLVHRLKQRTRLPVMHAGRMTTADTAERALREGTLDVALMTKTHIADPHFVRKVQEGRLEDIRYCTRSLQSCIGKMDRMTCMYNPVTSRERAWAALTPADRRKRVVIAGAGPAGMEAAITAHGRGHEVIVLERGERIGGQVHLAAAAPLRANLIRIAKFYERQAAKGLFDVRLSTEAGAEAVLALKPDAVVVATGSVLRHAPVPGDGEVWTVLDALTRPLDGKVRALVVDRRGFMEALAAADHLSAQGVAVDFVTPFSALAPDAESMTLAETLRRLGERGVTFAPGRDLASWDGNRAILRDTGSGRDRVLDAVDVVVIDAGADPVNALAPVLKDRVPEVHVIGDAGVPRTIEEATLHGAQVGRLL